MEFSDYTRFVLALVFVLALIGLLTWLVRRFGLAGRMPTAAKSAKRRLDIVEVAALDSRRRLVLVRRDRTEHLVLLGANADIVVESGIAADDADRDAGDHEPVPRIAESRA
jgi:flagellar protein FliO/FliZ